MGDREETNLWDTGAFFEAQFVWFVYEHVRAHGNVLCISASVGQAEHGVSLSEAAFGFRGQLLDDTAEFHAEGLGCLRGNRVLSFSLQQVHAVETKGLDADEGLSCRGLGPRDLVDEERGRGTFAVFDVWYRN